VSSQQLVGTVASVNGPVVGARVFVDDGPEAVTNEEGRWSLTGLPAGTYRLNATALGFESATREVEVTVGRVTRVDLTLAVAAVPIDPIVVSGTMSAMRVSESPVKVDVVSAALLQRNASSNLTESLGHINGLFTQVDCGVCGTNNIRINGMEGPYTGVLIDGMPIMGALASVYGLNGIDPALVERLEILKGPQSTLYGTEAMGGVINIITKDTRFAPRWSLDLSTSDLGRTNARAALAPDFGEVETLFSGSVIHNDRFVDDNGDGFSDVTIDTRVSLFGKANVFSDGRERLGVVVKAYHEDRFGGPEAWTEAHRGGSEIYGESIRTDRVEILGRSDLPVSDLRAEASYAWHEQDSFYGDQGYFATQHVGFAQLVWDPPRHGRHDWLVGASARVDDYDDDTPATVTSDRRFIPGVFVENSLLLSSGLTLLGGARVDHQDRHGTIASPRVAVRWRPEVNTTFRLNYGTGFRVVNLFTEDHAALTGAREVVIEDGLDPERSRSVTFNANRIIEFGTRPMMIDLDLFHTRFSNRIVPDYDRDPNQIVYANLDGSAVTRGVSLSLNQNFGDTPFSYTLGATVQDVYIESGGVREDEFFAADFRGVWSASYTFGRGVTVDYTGSVTGPMRLPEYEVPFTRPTRSGTWDVHNVQASVALPRGATAYLGVKNVFDFTQGSPLVDPGRPFGPDFDTTYVWGPIEGRRMVFGLRLAGSR